MIIENIVLKDFRCFYGENRIDFATGEQQNVTLVHAENGVGKTTLLNAFLWCFYERTTSRFEQKEKLLNLDAMADGRTSGFVEVQFSHEGKVYRARRTASLSDSRKLESSFKIVRLDSGADFNVPQPDTFINQVMPRDMSDHFLFDGEFPEIFMGEDNRASVRAAVQNILGCSLITTAIEDLAETVKWYRRQIPNKSSFSNVQDLNNELIAIDEDIEKRNVEKSELEAEIATTKGQLVSIRKHLENTAGAKDLEKRRVQLEAQKKQLDIKQRRKEADVLRWIGESAIKVVGKPVCDAFLDSLDESELKGRIPSPYNEEFVHDLLDAKICICGRPIDDHSDVQKHILSKLENAADGVLRNRLSKIRVTGRSFQREGGVAPGVLNKFWDELAEIDEETAQCDQDFGEVSLKLQDVDLEDVADREKRRRELESELEQHNRNVGRLETDIERRGIERADVHRKLEQAADSDKGAQVFLRRISACEALQKGLKKQLDEEEKIARGVLRSKVSDILQRTTRKPFKLSMTDDYGISLLDEKDNQLPRSSGENQLIGLAFTAALVAFAKDRQNAQDDKLLKGTVAPLVLDSPLGSLDPSYRRTVVETIPQMAGQVVLMISGSQGSKEVLDAIHDRIGSEFVLIRRNKEAGVGKGETKEFRGTLLDIATFENEFNGTEIKKVYG